MEVQYIGERLWAGQLGNAFIALAFAGGLLSVFSYWQDFKSRPEGWTSWKKLARMGFALHAFSIISIFVLLLFMLFNHYFEYYYVWQHSNKQMILKYIFSCLWEGQEGSFLLWMFWHIVLGTILIFSSKEWESGVLFVVGLVQLFLVSMIMGIVVELPGDLVYKIGSNPFTLLREHPDMMDMPFVKIPTYIQSIDGRGLNPLLQNYWMTIHPPTLFLGFASTVVPFAYAMAGLWQKKYNEWLKPALPWAFFGVMILGTGILMGGAWAYEALSFGGFWAWDPVENASLVPWLTLVGGAHLMLIHKNKGVSLFIAFFLIVNTFVLVLYSTFLTRSGVLGNASVHAFTDLGMTGQLLLYLFFFMWLPVVASTANQNIRNIYTSVSLLILTATAIFGFTTTMIVVYIVFGIVSFSLFVFNGIKYFPSSETEETFSSREMWMFIGALVLFISAGQIIFETSKPAFGKAFGDVALLNNFFPKNLAPASNAIEIYNFWQIIFASILTVLMAVGQYFSYKTTDMKRFSRNLLLSLFSTVILTAILSFTFNLSSNPAYQVLVFLSIFTVAANIDFAIRFARLNWRLIGPSVAHIGFAFVLAGAVISAGYKKIISANSAESINLEMLSKDFRNNENILLHKGDTVPMGDYKVVYQSDSISGINVYCVVDYFSTNGTHAFTLYPRIQTNPRMGNVAEPSTKHYIGKDIYTHITFIDPQKLKKAMNPQAVAQKEESTDELVEIAHEQIAEGDTLFATNGFVIFENLVPISKIDTTASPEDVEIKLKGVFRVMDLKGNDFRIEPLVSITEKRLESFAAMNEETGIKVNIDNIIPENKKIEVTVTEVKNARNDFIILQAIVFPGINILWLGCILMALGTFMAILKRIIPKKTM